MGETPGAVAGAGPDGPRMPGSVAEALALVAAGLSFLASADATGMTDAEQAGALRALGRAESMHLAATSRVLGAFSAGRGFEADCARSERSWLRWQTQVSSAAAGWAVAWSRRLAGHRLVAAALAAGTISPSYARAICELTDRLPAGYRDEGDEILLGAVTDGAVLRDLPGLLEEMLRRVAPPDRDDDDGRDGEGLAGRRLRLVRHYQGWGKLEGDLTPAASQALQAVLDALGGRAGPEDERTAEQRDHDVLEQVCRQFIAGGLPGRAGQSTRIELRMTLEQLLGLPGADAASAAWAAQAPAPPGADCDAAIVPVVTGHVDPALLGELAAARLAGPGTRPAVTRPADTVPAVTRPAGIRPVGIRPAGIRPADTVPASTVPSSTVEAGGGRAATAGMAMRAAGQLAIRDAARLLSGPGGLAGYLRTSLLTGPAASVSLPLDVGRPTETIPPHLRRAIVARDQHCGFPGCQVPASRCQVHHLIPRSQGGPTSLDNCWLGCDFHHLIAIHQWGWRVTLNPDGTTTAVSPDGKRVLHSHAPPTAA
jgi:Domain of unknown function (DUF222)/HNH endonuclease